jgi:7,8-dihydroneopterin aldolase/epimerase/oxygenase
MPDLIRVIDLEIFVLIGVSDEERREPQRLLISLEMSCDSFGPAAKRDDLALTVNYDDVCIRVKRLAAERPRKLLETLAEDLAAELLRIFLIQKVMLEIKKFIVPDTKYVSVTIERSASGMAASGLRRLPKS